MRGRIIIDLFTTLDGVAQAPGGRDEDTSDGFRFGGWQAPFPDDMVGAQVGAYIRSMDALLLGRRTYDIFAAYWPHHTDGAVGEIGRVFDRVPKYVASRSEMEPTWAGTTRIGGDTVREVDGLRDRHEEIHVVGSVGLVHTLLDSAAFDELRMWVHPVVLGEGRQVFPAGATPQTLRLIEPPKVGDHGVVQVRYEPAGPVVTGDMDDGA
ncbi:dihydrofolate reductase family protein [Microbacterium sp. NPDC077663]|uniref:dihydrofolate reductase family protein n=1 Tax=Microbacterium sp. NPDC077663 TaxID=3364189 RepID=UPI0037C87037